MVIAVVIIMMTMTMMMMVMMVIMKTGAHPGIFVGGMILEDLFFQVFVFSEISEMIF